MYPPVQSADEPQRYVAIAGVTAVFVMVLYFFMEAYFKPAWMDKLTEAKRAYFHTT